MEKQKLLEHAFINQLETDLNYQDFESLSVMIQLLIKNKNNIKIIVEYLSDTEKENLLKGLTNLRYE